MRRRHILKDMDATALFGDPSLQPVLDAYSLLNTTEITNEINGRLILQTREMMRNVLGFLPDIGTTTDLLREAVRIAMSTDEDFAFKWKEAFSAYKESIEKHQNTSRRICELENSIEEMTEKLASFSRAGDYSSDATASAVKTLAEAHDALHAALKELDEEAAKRGQA